MQAKLIIFYGKVYSLFHFINNVVPLMFHESKFNKYCVYKQLEPLYRYSEPNKVINNEFPVRFKNNSQMIVKLRKTISDF